MDLMPQNWIRESRAGSEAPGPEFRTPGGGQGIRPTMGNPTRVCYLRFRVLTFSKGDPGGALISPQAGAGGVKPPNTKLSLAGNVYLNC